MRCTGIIALTPLILALAACDARDTDADAAHPSDQRIVTLAPALTRMLVDLDVADRLVGVGEHDTAAPPGLTVVGHFADVDTETLVSLLPTHVLMQRTRQGPPARLRELADAGHFDLAMFPSLDAIDDVFAALEALGRTLDLADDAAQLARHTRDRLDRIRDITADREPPRVLMLLGTRSMMASGPGTVLDELLTIAGGRNAAADATVGAPTYDREAVIGLSPDVILLLSPNARPLVDNDPRLAELRDLPIAAVRDGRIHLIDDPLVHLPSTNVTRTALAMARAIHPGLADELDALRDAVASASADREPAP